MTNILRGPIGKKTSIALAERDRVHGSLPELTLKEQMMVRFLGGRALERLTRKQMIAATRENVHNIMRIVNKAEDPSAGLFIGALSKGSKNAGLPSTNVVFSTKKIAPGDKETDVWPTITFVSPLELPETNGRPLVDNPAFMILSNEIPDEIPDMVLVKLERRWSGYFAIDTLPPEQRVLAYELTTDVATILASAEAAGQPALN